MSPLTRDLSATHLPHALLSYKKTVRGTGPGPTTFILKYQNCPWEPAGMGVFRGGGYRGRGPQSPKNFYNEYVRCASKYAFLPRCTLVMRLIRSVITLVIQLSFLRRSSSIASCCHLSATSTCHIFQLYQTACQEHAYHFSPTFLLIATHRRSFCAGVVRFLQAAFFSLVSLVTSN